MTYLASSTARGSLMASSQSRSMVSMVGVLTMALVLSLCISPGQYQQLSQLSLDNDNSTFSNIGHRYPAQSHLHSNRTL